MKQSRTFTLILFIACTTISGWALDYQVDSTFVSPFLSNEIVTGVELLPGGKFLVVGRADGPGPARQPMVRRYNSDWTLDNTFAVPINGGTGQNGEVDSLQLLPNGQYLITGDFYTPAGHTNFARINADGSVDPTVAISRDHFVEASLLDGKFIACHEVTVNSTLYPVAHRLTSTGAFDNTFRITWADGGRCSSAISLPDGKVLIAGDFTIGGQPLKRLQRVNSDGSLDPTFNAAVTPGTVVINVEQLPDGKIMIQHGLLSGSGTLRRLLPDGGLDLEFPNCIGGVLGFEGSNYLINGCKKWSGAPTVQPILRVSETGVVDRTFDTISVTGLFGLFPAGGGSYWAWGSFSSFQGISTRRIARIVPNTTPQKAAFDFDGDGMSDISVYRPSNGTWYLYQSSAGIAYLQWGLSTDKIAAGDANRDGKTDIGVFRDGAWHALTSGTFEHRYMCLGVAGDTPFVLHNNDGLVIGDRFAVRGPRGGNTLWYLAGSTYSNCWVIPSQPTQFLVSGESVSDVPIAGDFNGDSRSEVGYYRDGVWQTADETLTQPPDTFQWGIEGDIPVPGDYDGDRQTDYAVYRPSTGDWWINRSTAGPIAMHWGTSGDIPVPADFDGDGKMDLAIYRGGTWWQYRMGTGQVSVDNWGLPDDIPVPAQSR